MRKQVLKLSVLVTVLIVIVVSLGFTSTKKTDENFYNVNRVTEPLEYTVSLEVLDVEEETMSPPFLGKSFNGFKEALAFKESRGDYFTVNPLGYMGKYQFGASTLKTIGVHAHDEFLNDPELQERAFIANLERNKWVLRKDIQWYAGKVFNGVKITESGILAAAHLAGPGNVKRYLRSKGVVGSSDINGASIRYYMRKFSNYDVSYVKADKAAKI